MIKYKLTELMRQWERENGEEIGKLTYRRLGELTGISPATLNRIGTNRAKGLENETIETLCEFFSCTPGDLISRISRDEEKN